MYPPIPNLFQSTLPARGATCNMGVATMNNRISIHAPRTGSDSAAVSCPVASLRFQSTLPARGATIVPELAQAPELISIHAPRTGSDTAEYNPIENYDNFNPRSPHGERHKASINSRLSDLISIHAPRTGSDYKYIIALSGAIVFQSTLPARGATVVLPLPVPAAEISIHAPRTGSDVAIAPGSARGTISIHAPRTGSDVSMDGTIRSGDYFNPRSPHGERHCYTPTAIQSTAFQSTLPARGATWKIPQISAILGFQSTLPARGATLRHFLHVAGVQDFNPRSPHGERLVFAD